jgi:3-hydroxyisobutyrate dehydrogenase
MAFAPAFIGFVGLGNMGRHMSRRLAEAGHAMIAFDVSADACAEAAAHGIEIAGSAREVADRAGVVLCSLPTPNVVRDVLLGAQGLCMGSALRLIIDLSTVGPAVAAEMAAALQERGIALVDAPVSGGTAGAAAGSLSVIVAGPDEAIAQAAPLLAVLGRAMLRIGPNAGQAQLAKLINNMLFGVNLVGALEAMAMGAKGGLDPTRLLEVINASSGRSYVTQTRIEPAVLHRDDQVRFATGLLHKDMQLGLAAARELDARLWMNEAAGNFLDQAMENGFAPRDYAAMIEIFEKWNGVSVLAASAGEKQ